MSSETPREHKRTTGALKRLFQRSPKSTPAAPNAGRGTVSHQLDTGAGTVATPRGLPTTLHHLLHPHEHVSGPKHKLRPDNDPVVQALLQRALFVRVVGATELPAADSNGLSDPYVVVNLADHRATTKIQQKTLNPAWDETFCFPPADVAAALQEAAPQVEFRVFDKDLLSSDDFLGMADLSLTQLDPATGSGGVIALELHGEGHSCGTSSPARHKHGLLQVALWFGPAEDEGVGAVALTLMPQLGAAGAPKVLHCGGSCLYEEPLFAGVAIRVLEVTGLRHDGGGGSSASSPDVKGSEAGGDAAAGKGWSLAARWRRRRARRRAAMRLEDDTELAGLEPLGEDGDGGHQALRDAGDADDWEAFSITSEGAGDYESASQGASPPASPAGEGAAHEELAAPSTGAFLYCRVVLGSQARVTKIVRERAQQRAVFRQQLAYVVPLPLRDRVISLEVYRTTSPQRKGKAIHTVQVRLLDLLPPLEGATPDLAATRSFGVPLVALPTGEHLSALKLSVAVVDLDRRRSLYGARFLPEAEAAVDGSTGSRARPSHLDAIERVPSAPQLAALSPRDMQHMAKLSEDEITAWQAERQRRQRAADALWSLPTTALATAGGLGRWGYTQMVAVAAWGASTAGIGWEAQQQSDAATPGADATLPPPLPPSAAAAVPQPLACLRISLEGLHLPRHQVGWSLSYLFCVIKVGPCWLRTPVVPAGLGPEVALDWAAEVPVFDPSSVMLLAVFDMRFKSGSRRHTTLGGAPQMVGKLRIRLSTLNPGLAISAQLPLLADRSKGGRRVGAAPLALRLTFASRAARVASYFKPALPEECYTHGVDELQLTLGVERRRMVLRWLDAASPPVQPAVALSLLDTEREEFSRSRLSANARRIRLAVAALGGARRFMIRVQTWHDVPLSLTACAVCIGLAYFPRMTLPALLLWAAGACVLAKPPTAGLPFGMEEDPDEAAEEAEKEERELDAEVASFRVLTRKYLALRKITLKVENVLEDVAIVLERAVALFTWQDPLATTLAAAGLAAAAALLVLLGPRFLQAVVMLFIIRPPCLRTPTPPPPAALFMRLPSHADRIV